MIWMIILLALISTTLGALGALCLKLSSDKLAFRALALLSNPFLIAGSALYVVASIIFIFALKLGELSVVYPMTALSYIWVALLARKILKERLHLQRYIGMGLIILGVVLISIQ